MKSNDWKEVKLGDVCDTISLTYKKCKDDVVLVNTSDVFNGKVLNHTFIKNENLRGQFKKSFQKDDILYSEIRPKNRRFAYIDFDAKNYIASTKLMVLRSNESILSRYLYQHLKSESVLIELQAIAESRSGTFPQITFAELSNILVSLPPIPEQKAIADTLSCIDDKIELNNKINKNLEAQAQAIFESWFVDFEPFQDGEFVDGELGRIPKGWRVGTLGDYVKVKSGFAFKSAWWRESGIPVIKIKNIGNNTLDLNDVSYVSKEKKEIAKDFIASAGDLLIAMTGATIGKFAIVPMCKNVLLVNQRVGKFFLGDNPIEKLPFIYNILGLDYVQEAIVTRGSGSAQPNISPTSIETIPIILPSADSISKFNNLAKSFYKNIIYNEQQTQTLTTLRDTLLPKLMSGEIRVPV